jgi:Domain of unknown function (DUF222)
MTPQPAPGAGQDKDPAPHVPAPGAGEGGDPVPRVPSPGGTRPAAAGVLTPDWMDEAEWRAACASCRDDECPPSEEDQDAEWFADPDHGPPPELAGVPFEVLAAQIEADGAHDAAATARMIELGVCREGYAHRPGAQPVTGASGSPAASFAQGAPYDTFLPDSLLGALADEASGPGRSFAGVTDDELMGLIGARQRLESRAAWELLVAVAEFARRRPEPGCKLDLPGRMPEAWSQHADAELGAQLRLSRIAADQLIGLAHALTAKLPATSAALRDGLIDLAKARIIAWQCDLLTPGEAAAAEALLLGDPGVGEMTPGMIRDRIARAVIQVNPKKAMKRREQAARARRVEVLREGSGNAMLAGRELPPAAVLAASQNLNRRARELRAAGVPGGMDELRVLAYLEKLGALDPLDGTGSAGRAADGSAASRSPGRGADDTDAGRPRHPGGGPDGRGGRGGPDGGGPGGGGRPGASGGAVPGTVPRGFSARVNMTVPLVTLLRLAERPGMLSGLGAIDPGLARDLAAAAARNPQSTWCLTVTDPAGRPVAHGCGRPPPRRPPRHDPAPPAPTAPTARDGPVYIPGDDHGPPGGYGTVRMDLPGSEPAPGGRRELVFALEALAGPCDHRHQAAGHDPGVTLKHLTGILNATCTFPPCRRPESQSDYEHSLAYEKGGRTCLCQAGPVCRANHRDKQSLGWHLQDAGARGWFRWTTPSGRSYLSRPTQYPD